MPGKRKATSNTTAEEEPEDELTETPSVESTEVEPIKLQPLSSGYIKPESLNKDFKFEDFAAGLMGTKDNPLRRTAKEMYQGATYTTKKNTEFKKPPEAQFQIPESSPARGFFEDVRKRIKDLCEKGNAARKLADIYGPFQGAVEISFPETCIYHVVGPDGTARPVSWGDALTYIAEPCGVWGNFNLRVDEFPSKKTGKTTIKQQVTAEIAIISPGGDAIEIVSQREKRQKALAATDISQLL